jgi:hypothetical protein
MSFLERAHKCYTLSFAGIAMNDIHSNVSSTFLSLGITIPSGLPTLLVSGLYPFAQQTIQI